MRSIRGRESARKILALHGLPWKLIGASLLAILIGIAAGLAIIETSEISLGRRRVKGWRRLIRNLAYPLAKSRIHSLIDLTVIQARGIGAGCDPGGSKDGNCREC
jgi:hypothetical protein